VPALRHADLAVALVAAVRAAAPAGPVADDAAASELGAAAGLELGRARGAAVGRVHVHGAAPAAEASTARVVAGGPLGPRREHAVDGALALVARLADDELAADGAVEGNHRLVLGAEAAAARLGARLRPVGERADLGAGQAQARSGATGDLLLEAADAAARPDRVGVGIDAHEGDVELARVLELGTHRDLARLAGSAARIGRGVELRDGDLDHGRAERDRDLADEQAVDGAHAVAPRGDGGIAADAALVVHEVVGAVEVPDAAEALRVADALG